MCAIACRRSSAASDASSSMSTMPRHLAGPTSRIASSMQALSRPYALGWTNTNLSIPTAPPLLDIHSMAQAAACNASRSRRDSALRARRRGSDCRRSQDERDAASFADFSKLLHQRIWYWNAVAEAFRTRLCLRIAGHQHRLRRIERWDRVHYVDHRIEVVLERAFGPE